MTNFSLKVWIVKIRNCHPEVFCEKDAPKNFSNFTGKHLCQSLSFIKVAGLCSGAGVFLWNLGNFSEHIFLIEYLVSASDKSASKYEGMFVFLLMHYLYLLGGNLSNLLKFGSRNLICNLSEAWICLWSICSQKIYFLYFMSAL